MKTQVHLLERLVVAGDEQHQLPEEASQTERERELTTLMH